MSFDDHKDLAYSTVLTAPSPASSGTSLVVQSGHGARLPATPFDLAIWPVSSIPTLDNCEIVRVTNKSTDTLTITRAQYGTSARSVVVGDQVAAVLTDQMLDAIQTEALAKGAGRYLGTTVLTSASGTFTTQAGTTTIKIRGVAGGGGGGGTPNDNASRYAGGGGGAGGYAEKTFTVTGSTGYNYTCGAAGAGSSGADGTDGADSTFIVGGTTVTAKKGLGGKLGISAKLAPGGAGGAVSTSGDLNGGGAPGVHGDASSANAINSGAGGSDAFGGGGVGVNLTGSAQTAGVAATGKGAGGGGAATNLTAGALAGGNGTAGTWVVDEYS